jgi:hypothetical protein
MYNGAYMSLWGWEGGGGALYKKFAKLSSRKNAIFEENLILTNLT